jgi:uncharacterized protein YecE (DUF72 family)
VSARLFVGPAGWSYDDWQGIVYPRTSKADALDRLDAIARLFNLVEINTSFYGPPSPRTTEQWVERVRAIPGFRFTAKLVRRFTHEDPSTWKLADRDTFRDGMQPLREAGLLGPLLCQFPHWFTATDESFVRLARIRRAFPDDRLVLEVRHRSWIEPASLARVRDLGCSFCNLDQPRARDSIELGAWVTGPIGYLRLHGRNAAKWFDRNAKVHEKYDWAYSEEETRELVAVAADLRERTEELHVVANNHYVGKGPATALEIAQALTGVLPELPASLVAAFPRLARKTAERPAARASSEGGA